MRHLLSSIAVGSTIWCLQLAALPHPQVADTADVSGVDTSTDPGTAQPFPDAGQSTDSGDTSVVSAPSAPDNDSGNTNTSASDVSPLANVTHIDPPVELTGQVMGMPSCNGTYYNPRWDKCDQATGTVTSRPAALNEKRLISIFCPQNLPPGVASPDGCEHPNPLGGSPPTGERKSRRQEANNSGSVGVSDQVQDPSVMNGRAGIDDGAMASRHGVAPPYKRQASGYNNFWNTPFGLPQSASPASPNSGPPSEVPQTPAPPPISPFTGDLGKREPQDANTKSPGNSNFWNTPFELPQDQGPTTTEELKPGNKTRRQLADSAINVAHNTGPLEGEDQVLDGSYPALPPDNANKTKRQNNDSNDWSQPTEDGPHVAVGPPGLGGARNIIINKRENSSIADNSKSNDPTGYLGKLGQQSSGLNFEDPSVDPATPPKDRPKREPAQPDFDYVAPHHDGNNVAVGRPGPDRTRNTTVNKRQANSSSSNGNEPTGYLGELGNAAVAGNGLNFENPIVDPATPPVKMSKRDAVYEDAEGRLVVKNHKREGGGVTVLPMPRRRNRIVRKDDMTRYTGNPEEDFWDDFWLDHDNENESGSDDEGGGGGGERL